MEELSASAADKKQAKSTKDPLDVYCDDNPEADECRQDSTRSLQMHVEMIKTNHSQQGLLPSVCSGCQDHTVYILALSILFGDIFAVQGPC